MEALKKQLQTEVDAAVGFILENLAALSLLEDKAVALAEASQVGHSVESMSHFKWWLWWFSAFKVWVVWFF